MHAFSKNTGTCVYSVTVSFTRALRVRTHPFAASMHSILCDSVGLTTDMRTVAIKPLCEVTLALVALLLSFDTLMTAESDAFVSSREILPFIIVPLVAVSFAFPGVLPLDITAWFTEPLPTDVELIMVSHVSVSVHWRTSLCWTHRRVHSMLVKTQPGYLLHDSGGLLQNSEMSVWLSALYKPAPEFAFCLRISAQEGSKGVLSGIDNDEAGLYVFDGKFIVRIWRENVSVTTYRLWLQNGGTPIRGQLREDVFEPRKVLSC
jgi:hypothetical protein